VSSKRPQTVIILCGGRGTRLGKDNAQLPKPLIQIGDKPLLWHVLQIYISQGIKQITLCLGYKGDLIAEFINKEVWPSDLTISCLKTGADTPTGGRIKQAVTTLAEEEENFFVTYADGLADINLAELSDFHSTHSALATLTLVKPDLPFGIVTVDDQDKIRHFMEKPKSRDYVSGGFFCFKKDAIHGLTIDSSLEEDLLPMLAREEQLYGYTHQGFWHCIDTYKDQLAVNQLLNKGKPPWLRESNQKIYATQP